MKAKSIRRPPKLSSLVNIVHHLFLLLLSFYPSPPLPGLRKRHSLGKRWAPWEVSSLENLMASSYTSKNESTLSITLRFMKHSSSPPRSLHDQRLQARGAYEPAMHTLKHVLGLPLTLHPRPTFAQRHLMMWGKQTYT